MPTTIDSLQVEVNASSQSAQQGISSLIDTLDRLKNVTKGGLGLRAVVNSLKKTDEAARNTSADSSEKISRLADALSKLENLGQMTVSSSVAHQLKAIGDVGKALSPDAGRKIASLGQGLQELRGLKDIQVSSTLAANLGSLGQAAGQLAGKNFSGFRNLAQGLAPLGNLPRTNLGSLVNNLNNLLIALPELNAVDTDGLRTKMQSLGEALAPLSQLQSAGNLTATLNQLRRFPETAAALNAVDMGAFKTKVTELTDALAPLAQQMQAVGQGFSGFPAQVQGAINATNRMTSANRSMAASYVGVWAMFRMARNAISQVANKMASWINKANSYIEDVNLFTASMGEYATQARHYAERVGELMGIDPGKWMRNQGIFQTLATGFGISADRAYIMSKNLTQLGYDLSSFFNIAVEGEGGAMQKLQAGLSGELEPLRRLGFDLSEARLKAIALALGIDQTYNSMTQAQKAQLRYMAIMNQVTTAQGDMARTLETPANQLRVLKAQAEQAARAFGNTLIPALNAVLPVAIALATALRIIGSAIASLFGFVMPSVDYSGIEGATSAVDDLDNSLQGAGGSAKKLKGLLAGWDELNIIQSEGGGGGGGGGAQAFADMWNFDLPEYDFLGNLIKTRADDLIRQWKPAIDWIVEHLEGILSITEAIGAGMLLWSVSKKLLPELTKNLDMLNKIKAVAVAGATMIITYSLVASFDKRFEKSGDWLNIIADGLTTTLGAAIAGKVVASQFGNTAGLYTASLTVAISALASLTTAYEGIKENGINGRDMVLDVIGVVKAGVAGAIAGYAVAGISAVATGAIIGIGIGVGVALILGAVAWAANEAEKAKTDAYWGNISLTAQEMQVMANKLFKLDVKPTISLAKATIDNADSAKTQLEATAAAFNANLNLIKLGVNSADTYTSILNTVTGGATDGTFTEDSLIGQLSSTLSNLKDVVKLGVSLMPPVNGEGEAMDAAQILESMGLSQGIISETVSGIGAEIGRIYAESIGENMELELDKEKSDMILKLGNWLNEINQAVLTGKLAGTALGNMQIKLGDLDQQSFGGVLSAYREMQEELKTAFSDLAVQQESAMYSMAAGLEAVYTGAKEIYGETDERTVKAFEAWQQQLKLAQEFSPTETVNKYMEQTEAGAREQVLEALRTIFEKQFDDTQYFMSELQGMVYSSENNWGTWANLGGDEYAPATVAEMLTENLTDNLKGVLKEEDFASLQDAIDTFHLNIWDLVGNDLINQMYQQLTQAYGEESANRVMEALGVDIADGLANAVSKVPEIVQEQTEAAPVMNEVTQNLMNALTKFDPQNADMTARYDYYENVLGGIVDEMLAGAGIEGEKADEIWQNFFTEWSNALDKGTLDGSADGLVKKLQQSITEAAPDMTSAGSALSGAAVEGFKSADAYGGGQYVASQFAKGLASVKMPSLGFGYGGGIAIPKIEPVAFAASGGVFDQGQLFVAREAGAEMVGRIGNKTAVVNNEQIESGIAKGVSQATRDQNELLREQNRYLRAIAAKDLTLAPSAAAGRWIRQSEEMRLRQEGV